MPSKALDILTNRILEHVQNSENPRLLRFVKRGNKQTLSRVFEASQLKKIEFENLRRVIETIIKRSSHLVIKHDSIGGTIHNLTKQGSLL